MTVVVTGGTGFLGSAVVALLGSRGEVVALHRPGSAPEAVAGVRWVAQDLAAPLSAELPERVDAVVHLAQSRRYREFPDGAIDVYAVNSAMTVALLDYARRAGAATFTYASSGAIYASGPEPVHEDDTPRPANFYAVSKLAGELATEQFRSELRAHVLRFFFIYGPGQRNMFIPGVLGRIRDSQEVTLAGADGIHVNPVYVEDAAAAVAATLELADSATLNVAGPDVVSLREIAELGGRALGRAPSFAAADPQPDLVASIERMSAAVGAPKVGVEEGLRRTVEAGL
ncbi:MAG: NAD(P)-dependent oxidoreductase [Solirubrobacteraceae bacterium]